jgi:hypothetical protein
MKGIIVAVAAVVIVLAAAWLANLSVQYAPRWSISPADVHGPNQ